MNIVLTIYLKSIQVSDVTESQSNSNRPEKALLAPNPVPEAGVEKSDPPPVLA